MVLTISIHPDWPYIVTLAFIGACLYAWLVVTLNNDPRLGRYWRANTWVEVAGGVLFMALTAGFVAGPVAAAVILAAAALWGAPMIVAVLVTTVQEQAAADEQADAAR